MMCHFSSVGRVGADQSLIMEKTQCQIHPFALSAAYILSGTGATKLKALECLIESSEMRQNVDECCENVVHESDKD